MYRHARSLLVGLVSTGILVIGVGSASAGRLSVSHQRTKLIWLNLEFRNTVSEARVSCPMTLEGSFHSATFKKIRGLLVYSIETGKISSGSCTGGKATIAAETLPWTRKYESFGGTLPNIIDITSVIPDATYLIEISGNTCKGTTRPEAPAAFIDNLGTGGRVESVRADETRRIPLVNGPGGSLCALASGIIAGTGSVRQVSTSTFITITLI